MIEKTYKLTKQDYIDAYNTSGAERHMRVRSIFSLAFLFVIAGIVIYFNFKSTGKILNPSTTVSNKSWLTGSVFVSVIMAVVFYILARLSQRGKDIETILKISSEGLSVEANGQTNIMKWNLFESYALSETVFVLYIGKIFNIIIPRRVLDAYEIETMIEFLKSVNVNAKQAKDKLSIIDVYMICLVASIIILSLISVILINFSR